MCGSAGTEASVLAIPPRNELELRWSWLIKNPSSTVGENPAQGDIDHNLGLSFPRHSRHTILAAAEHRTPLDDLQYSRYSANRSFDRRRTYPSCPAPAKLRGRNLPDGDRHYRPLATLIPPHSALRLGDLRHSTSHDELDIEAFMWLIRTALPVMMRRALETSARVWGTGSSSTGSGSTRSRR